MKKNSNLRLVSVARAVVIFLSILPMHETAHALAWEQILFDQEETDKKERDVLRNTLSIDIDNVRSSSNKFFSEDLRAYHIHSANDGDRYIVLLQITDKKSSKLLLISKIYGRAYLTDNVRHTNSGIFPAICIELKNNISIFEWGDGRYQRKYLIQRTKC